MLELCSRHQEMQSSEVSLFAVQITSSPAKSACAVGAARQCSFFERPRTAIVSHRIKTRSYVKTLPLWIEMEA
jgi:hypothetical protein